jgi:outer membrane receptor for ferric coprogen and ferric-rhodotorulic acid
MSNSLLSLCGLTALALLTSAARAGETEDATAAAAAPAPSEGVEAHSDVIVFGKSYGEAVGKTVTPLKDVPNTVTLLDRTRLELQNLFTLEDALTATVGITVNGVGSEDPSFLSRGFAINNYLVDGVATMSFGFPAVVPDLFFYDRMEVLRGPAGLFSGSGNPAGSVNLIRKRPLDSLQARASAGIGSHQNVRLELDVSMPLGAGARLRAGVLLQDQDQFFDVAHRNRLAGFAIATLPLGERTTLTLGGDYDRYKPAIQSGLPGIIGGTDGSDGQLPDVARSTYLGADWNRFRSESWSLFGELAHELSSRWTVRATAHLGKVDRIDVYSYIGNQPITPTNGVTSHIAYRGDNFQDTQAADINLIGSFTLFGREQTLIVGADHQARHQISYYTRLSNYARIDVYAPVSPVEPPLDPYGPLPAYQGPAGPVTQVYGASDTEVDQQGVYGQLRLSPLAGLTLVGGGRLTWWETRSTTLLPTLREPTGYAVNGRFTPYAGIVWDVTSDLNLYASYADSFTPQTSSLPRADGAPIEPLIGAQYEAGSKLALFGDTLLLSAAAYQITQSNRLFSDTQLPGVVLQIGKVRARGLELEAAGDILPGWRINGGYSYTRTKYLEDSNPLYEGISFVPVIPRHSIKAFTNYAPETGSLAGFSLGGGLTWFSSTWGGNPAVFNTDGTLRTRSSIVRQGSYAVVDLRAGYKLSDRLSVSVNVSNLLDRTYFARISATGRGNYYGSPRSVFATLRLTLQ